MISEIIFQFGEFYTKSNSWIFSLITTIIGAGIGSSVTIWVLYATFKHNKKIESEKLLQSHEHKIKYLRSNIKSILNNLEIQIKSFGDFAENIKKNPLYLPTIKQVPLNELDRVVNKLNLEEYYISYIAVFGTDDNIVEEFREIISMLNFFEGNIAIFKNTLQTPFNLDNERKIKFAEIVEDSMDDIATILNNTEIENNDNDFWQFLNSTMLKYTENLVDPADLKYINDNYLEIVKKGILPFSKTVIQVHPLLMKLKRSTYIYNDIIFQNNQISTNFEILNKKMDDIFKEFTTYIKRLLEFQK